MFVDASALCAILLAEPERDRMERVIGGSDRAFTSAVAIWETARALVREEGITVTVARHDVETFLADASIATISIGETESRFALDAFDRFGKGRHPAALNMGDCFTYACARSLGVPLLYKGDDFLQTDIAAA
ncbi:type II toxin-antitoxin system VapC family toxin [Brevundimonas sp.]|uniref:type II toxin-antitoxin system VapC family toxin n=1 Tax=Brevundimonas sp. TaxID=1871086 RepID=UPI001A2BF685|nr:type II toxin-antitoxin system VapC family toxin [Brevundimonas sp.]MBJ7486299.1 type II toxin-antitoxin system VapC family toxin [Brevundimonas sp.]